MKKTVGDVFKKMIGWFLIVGILGAVVSSLMELIGLPMQAISYDSMSAMNGDMASSFQFSAIGGIVSLIYMGLTGLLSKGLVLSTYRYIRYDTQPKFEHLFFFFNRRFGFNFLYSLLENVVVFIGLAVFVVPGVILGCGLFPSAILLAKLQDEGTIGQVFKETWKSTKGYKGKIFLRFFVFILIMIFIMVLGLGVSSASVMMSGSMGGSGLFVGILTVIILVVACMLLMVTPYVMNILDLTYDNRFEKEEPLEFDEEDLQEDTPVTNPGFERELELQEKINQLNREDPDKRDDAE